MKQIERTITKRIYIAEDGTEFEDEWDCICHDENCFLKTIHAIDNDFMEATNVEDIVIFTISNKDQIKTLKEYAKNDDRFTALLKSVTDIGIYVLKATDDWELCFCKYPENF